MGFDPDYVAEIQKVRPNFELETDELGRAMLFFPAQRKNGIPRLHYGKSAKTNPHMRAFWAATVAFTFAFIGWFAFAPLMPMVRVDIGICDNADAVAAMPEDERVKGCVCKKSCKQTIADSTVAAVSFDIVTRFMLGSVIEAIGPVKTDIGILTWGAACVAGSTLVTDGTGLILARLFISALGASFVVNQFWNAIMFNNAVLGTANATAGGWGNMGGGLTQVSVPAVYKIFKGMGWTIGQSWRAAMFFPVILYILTCIWIWFSVQDTVTGKWDVRALGKSEKATLKDYLNVLKDYRVVLLIFQYGATFGQELVFNAILVSHFYDFFGVDLMTAGVIALCFGGMNLFARSIGGVTSDGLNATRGMQGRLWAHFGFSIAQSGMLFVFGLMSPDFGGVGGAVAVLCILASFMNAAEGTAYALVPYMIPEQVALVSAFVGAGGTLGAVIATWAFYKYIEDTLLPIKLHALYCAFWALTILLMRWDHLGSFFAGAKENVEAEKQVATKRRRSLFCEEVITGGDEPQNAKTVDVEMAAEQPQVAGEVQAA